MEALGKPTNLSFMMDECDEYYVHAGVVLWFIPNQKYGSWYIISDLNGALYVQIIGSEYSQNPHCETWNALNDRVQKKYKNWQIEFALLGY